VTGFSQHTSSQFSSSTALSITSEADYDHVNATCSATHHSKTVTKLLASRGSELSSSDDYDSLSDSSSNVNSNDERFSSEDELSCSGAKRYSKWEAVDELRLLTYWQERRPWKWIFRKFSGRTEGTIRNRLSKILSENASQGSKKPHARLSR